MRGVGRRSALRASAVAQRKTKTKDNATHCILSGLATYSEKNTAIKPGFEGQVPKKFLNGIYCTGSKHPVHQTQNFKL